MAVPVSAVPAANAATNSDAAVQAMVAAADGGTAVRENPATGRVGFVRATAADGDLMPGKAAEGRAGAVEKAAAYLERYATNFGARTGELSQSKVFASDAGWSITFEQAYQGVPVFGAQLKAHVDRDGDLTSVNGYAAPNLSLSVTPRFSKAEASARALGAVKAAPSGYEDGLPGSATEGLSVRSADLMVYRTGSTRGIAGEAKLAWVVEVWNQASIRETVILDATTNKPLNRWSMMAHAIDRELYEESHTPDARMWAEGQEFPGALNEDQQNEVLATGESYWMYMNTFGYDGWDGDGGKMITVNNDPRINCPNANWNGVTTNYCDGVTGDDTVAHEWGHAYTESTSGLIYQWQSGAMNEAYSDIWGETVDMLNSRHNEGGETAGDVTYRTPGKCTDKQPSPYDMEVAILAPASIAGECTAAPGFGTDLPETPIVTDVVVGVDAANPAGPSTTDGCSPFDNAAAIKDNWVYVDRGTCTYQIKVDNAEAAGALGMVVGNNTRGLQGMAGTTDIYTVAVTQADGAKIKSVTDPVEMSFAKSTARYTDTDYRWLSGESDPAFGGAIRDLWNPTCFGDPGKVSDAEYHCTEDDGGGVHTNSGVVNRTFAILVDGQDGQGTGIGLDKAANLFWHAQTNYLTPTSFFPDLADGLEASCTDLTGVDINKITLGSPTKADGSDGAATPEKIPGGMTAADCAQVTAAIAETELRMDPTAKCGWKTMLASGAPKLNCGPGKRVAVSYSENFDNGIGAWTQDEELGFEFSEGIEWQASAKAPGGHASGVAFGPDPISGNCGAPGDLTSRNGLISPAITVPSGPTAQLSFDHYVATEATWDGGNLKIKVGNGEFKAVPSDAYVFNAPAGKLDVDSGVMGGEAAWTGTDGGKLSGSWGTTIVNLSKIAKAGETIQLRFDMARDGCNGLDGWYIDNVEVAACSDLVATKTTAVHVPEPSTEGTASAVEVTVARDGSTGSAPVGTVDLVKADGTKVSSGTLNASGKATLPVPADLAVGKHTLMAKYLGDATFAASQATVVATVTSATATSKTKIKLMPKKPKAGAKTTIKITVKASDKSKVTGKVKIKLDGKKFRTVKVKNGKAKIVVKKGFKRGKHKLVAKYTGTASVAKSKATKKFMVRR